MSTSVFWKFKDKTKSQLNSDFAPGKHFKFPLKILCGQLQIFVAEKFFLRNRNIACIITKLELPPKQIHSQL